MHADHDTAIRAALAQVRDDMRAGVIDPGGVLRRLLSHLSADLGTDAAYKLFRSQHRDRRFRLLLWGNSNFIITTPAAIDRYLAGDEPWPAKETTNAAS